MEAFASPGQAGFGRILLAIDQSVASGKAMAAAARIALRWNGEVLVVHVRERQLARNALLQVETPEDAVEMVNQAVYELARAGIRATGKVGSTTFGRVPNEIVAIANREGTELIVMGSRGLSCLRGLLQSSVSHKVVHLAKIPVLVVPP